jgi:predicted O-methyltransferase YrrM
MNDPLYRYLLQHTREPAILRKVRDATSTMRGYNMQTPPEQVQLLGLLIEIAGAKNAIEVGVYTGYSAVAIALALPSDGKLVACERDGTVLNVARGFLEEAGLSHKVDFREGIGKETLDALLAEGGCGQYDFVYIDADKRGYAAYFEQSLQLVRPGGLIALDNVLWYGRVIDSEVNDKQTVAIRALNEQLVNDERITFSLLPIGDGVSLCRKR